MLRLARGEEIPCFALTNPTPAPMPHQSPRARRLQGPDGKLMLKLNWDKRYITLAAVSTILGLAFRLKDPETCSEKAPIQASPGRSSRLRRRELPPIAGMIHWRRPSSTAHPR